MLHCAITERALFPGNEFQRLSQLLEQVRELACTGLAYLQIREKDLPASDLESLAASICGLVRQQGSSMRVLLNGPAEIALRTGCHGVHLPGHASPEAAAQARRLYAQAGRTAILSAACHTIADVEQRSNYADLLVFAPVFEKVLPDRALPGLGLEALASAVRAAQGKPVLALGGVTAANAPLCIEAGAAGIAAIRLFMTQDWKTLLSPPEACQAPAVPGR
ncbi:MULTISPECIES: thiamine phosphate synthase [Acidobacterium]|uniref:Putative thiamine-phosphate pyrophosphorylase n=1 Tax=Acidobacterium capsulatum (strain ATCC 51196 / DSM 11244 / BCRC 80197 / JCM 7670 / NBRC 15755 / NCIMB 13165 / 161) TaxID=240015 RepID=C1F178_ACIC5|nr:MULTISPECIES: thiamine phosphate synthase [Acidobacterium]ACO34323.1 putative thiamine-phosphate pyrophosphorylase [Acidobacterium capsulatum ATCC 51196]HCT62410.1 thiamine phosphate synthase [Acidobacterium sp.]